MTSRIAFAAAGVAAALLTACGASDSACSSRDADLAASAITPSNCTAAAGSTVSIPVNLCPKCTDSRAACQAEFRNGVIEIAPIFYECEENRGCQLTSSCENNPATRRVSCDVSIPTTVGAGQYDIVNSGTATTVGSLFVTTGSSSCAFAVDLVP